MNKKFTKLIAALALLVFMTPSLAGWGQAYEQLTSIANIDESAQYVLGIDGTGFHYEGTSNWGKTALPSAHTPIYYTLTKASDGNSFTAQATIGGTTYYLQIPTSNTFSMATSTGTNTDIIIGTTQVSGTNYAVANKTTTARHLRINGTSGLRSYAGTTGTMAFFYKVVTSGSGTTYTVTFDAGDGTFVGNTDFPNASNTVAAGTYTLPSATPATGYTFNKWNIGDETYDAGASYTVSGDAAFVASYTQNGGGTGGDEHWVLTNLADLTADDVFVIVGNNGSNYAMSNDNGTDPAPSAVAVTVANDEITSTVAANIQWNISSDANGYTFYPNGSTTTWLYCTNTNNGVRVGTNVNKTFVVDHDYLKHTFTSRYVGIYNSQDWRCYTSYTATNIANQTFAFYKKVTGGVVPPTITAANVDITYDATNGNIAYTINNGVEGGSMSASTTSDWLTLGDDFTSPIAFTCSANAATTTRTATVTLTYTYGDNETVTKDVTVTQAAAPLIYTTIPDIFDAATSTSTNVNVTFGNWVVSGVNGSNAFVTDNSGNGFIIYTSDHGFVVNDKLSGTVMGTPLKLYKGSAEFTNLSSTTDGLTVSNDGSITVITDKTIANLGGVNTGAVITLSNLTYDGTNLSDGTNTIKPYNTLYSGMSFTSGKIYNVTGVYQQYDNTKEILPRSADDIEEVVSAEPSVTVTPNTIDAPSAGEVGTLAITYANIPDLISFDYYFCDAEGNGLEDTDPNYPGGWIYAEINDENDVYSLGYLIDANDGEARTAYIKVYTTDVPGNEEVYAIVTVNQAEYVIDYATLPFEWEGGLPDAFDALNGTTLNSVDSYPNQTTYQMKLDADGDYIQIKCDQQPGVVTFGVKMVGGNKTSSIIVQGSSDGETFTDVQTFEISGNQNSIHSFETTNTFASNDRYVRLYFSKGTGSNVGVGPIWIDTYVAPTPTITVESTTISATAEETQGTLNVTYTAIETSLGASVYWYTDNTGTTATDEPGWISAAVNETTLNVDYVIAENNGEARTAYFKVYGIDAEFNDVYSELVTITQAAAPQQYTLTVEPFENLEIITFVNDEMVMEVAGTIQVTEGDEVMLSIVADEGYVMETLMVNGVNHVNDIAGDFTYTFEMPAEAVTISATAVEQVAPAGGDYVRITSLDQLTDGSIVVIAARYDEEHTNGYYAMPNATTGRPDGVQFTSTTSGDNEILPASIVNDEDDYYWVVNETENGYTFTNAEGQKIGYGTSGTSFGGNNIEWTIEQGTSDQTALVGEYTGFVIKNKTTNTRAFAYSSTGVFGAYATSNMANATYNFFLDFFVQSEAPVTETYELTINGYGNSTTGGWYLIASPVATTPDQVTNMLTNETEAPYSFDLYRFNQAAASEWENYHQHTTGFNIVPGQGYLYANKGDVTAPSHTVTLTFTGVPYDGDGIIPLTYSTANENANMHGWNLVGNPFNANTTIEGEFYIMNEVGSDIVAANEDDIIAPMQGIFVRATEEGQNVTFTPASEGAANNNSHSSLSINLSNTASRSASVIDRAIVRFGESKAMPKFQLFENNTKLYIPQNGEDFSVVSAEAQGEMPVSFKAAQNGTYTLTVNPENVEMNYLHLIDNLTGANVDLLATPSYTFNAKTTDYESRFRLVFVSNSVFEDENDNDSFAFFSNGQLVIANEGQATLQVIDVTGRILSSETVNGSVSKSINASTGVYMLRLINGENVKVQKIVVR